MYSKEFSRGEVFNDRQSSNIFVVNVPNVLCPQVTQSNREVE